MAIFKSMDSYLKALDKKLDKYQDDVAFAVFEDVKQLTPVDTGYAKSRWEIDDGNWGSSTRITNDAPYIGMLENGWSKQAPRGMIKVAMARLAAKGGLGKDL